MWTGNKVSAHLFFWTAHFLKFKTIYFFISSHFALIAGQLEKREDSNASLSSNSQEEWRPVPVAYLWGLSLGILPWVLQILSPHVHTMAPCVLPASSVVLQKFTVFEPFMVAKWLTSQVCMLKGTSSKLRKLEIIERKVIGR